MKNTNKYSRSLLLSSLLIASASVAGAAVTEYAGTFSATFPTNPVGEWESYQGIPAISGSWSFTFDDSAVVSGAGTQYFTVGLDSFSMTPGTINLTEFNSFNTGAQLMFTSGVLINIFVGEIGWESTVGSGRDGFTVGYYGQSQEVQLVAVSSATTSDFQNGLPISGAFTSAAAVPEPGSSVLAVTAVAGLLLRRSRRA